MCNSNNPDFDSLSLDCHYSGVSRCWCAGSSGAEIGRATCLPPYPHRHRKKRGGDVTHAAQPGQHTHTQRRESFPFFFFLLLPPLPSSCLPEAPWEREKKLPCVQLLLLLLLFFLLLSCNYSSFSSSSSSSSCPRPPLSPSSSSSSSCPRPPLSPPLPPLLHVLLFLFLLFSSFSSSCYSSSSSFSFSFRTPPSPPLLGIGGWRKRRKRKAAGFFSLSSVVVCPALGRKEKGGKRKGGGRKERKEGGRKEGRQAGPSCI